MENMIGGTKMNAREKKMLKLLQAIRDGARYDEKGVCYELKMSPVFFDTVLKSLISQFEQDLGSEGNTEKLVGVVPCSD